MNLRFVSKIRKNLFLNLWAIISVWCLTIFLFIVSKSGIEQRSLEENREIIRLIDVPFSFVNTAYIASIIWIVFQRRKLRSRVDGSLGFRWHRMILGAIYWPVIPLFFGFDIERLSQIDSGQPIDRQTFRSIKAKKIGFIWFGVSVLFLTVGMVTEVGNVVDYFTIGPSNMTNSTRYVVKFGDSNMILEKLDQYSSRLWLACVAFSLVTTFLAFATLTYLRHLSKTIEQTNDKIEIRKIGRFEPFVMISLGLLIALVSISNFRKATSSDYTSKSPISISVPKVEMPDVVCMNLQDAQNLIQDQGVFLSRSIDATDQDRNQIYDRNWIVVEQNIPAGVVIGENEVVLSVLREDEIKQDSECFGYTE